MRKYEKQAPGMIQGPRFNRFKHNVWENVLFFSIFLLILLISFFRKGLFHERLRWRAHCRNTFSCM